MKGSKISFKMTIKEIQKEIIDEFEMFDDWMDRYEYLIELRKSLPVIDDQLKVEENIIKGCQSKYGYIPS